jgi:hypothetical protein
VYGEAATFSATVKNAAGVGTPNGSATFVIDGVKQKTSAPLDASGVARMTISTLAVGQHAVGAVYNPSADFATSSPTSPQMYIVSQAATFTTVTATPTAAIGASYVTVTATVHVAAPGSGTPFGTVTFLLDGVKGVTLSVNAAAQATTKYYLGAGVHSVSAIYNGNLVKGINVGSFVASPPAAPQTVTIFGPQPTSLSSVVTTAASALTVNTPFSIAVTALNGLGQRAAGYNAPVSVLILSAPPNGTITGNLTGTLSSSVFTFTGLSATVAGTYSLEIVSGSLVEFLTLSIADTNRAK